MVLKAKANDRRKNVALSHDELHGPRSDFVRQVIESPVKCEVRPVIRFWTARNISTADIHCQITEVYGAEAMRSKVQKWVKKFKDGRTNFHVT
ncbi:HTH_48 domain-containing protein [Trichonephila clavipes]|uniref:HTH_48 domain-containing protein n=1 Tax=Trichonephila clavipes TaxID=2585209 RepID=A0A8X6RZ56_TRICX|nr:HTH_48 domain-containing protein [Trichonephila clavipes]